MRLSTHKHSWSFHAYIYISLNFRFLAELETYCFLYQHVDFNLTKSCKLAVSLHESAVKNISGFIDV